MEEEKRINTYLIPANSKKSMLMLGVFNKIDLAIFCSGIGVSLKGTMDKIFSTNNESNEDTEINYGELLKKININEQDLSANIYFDLTIQLDSGKTFKAESIKLTIPNSNLINNGKVGQEHDYTEKIIFKRIKN